MKLAKAIEMVEQLKSDSCSSVRFRNYCDFLSSDRDKKLFDDQMYSQLVSLDKTGLTEKTKTYLDSIGFAQSIYSYDQIEMQINNFLKDHAPNRRWLRAYKRALQQLMGEVRKARLKVLKYSDRQSFEEALPKKDTHPGFSKLVTGLGKKGDYLEQLPSMFFEELDRVRCERSINRPILIGTRTQASGAFDDGEPTGTFKPKSRLVSIIDILQILIELTWAKPFQNWIATQDWYAGGKNDDQINGLIQRWRSQGYHMLTIDYSNYDQSIPGWLIEDAFSVVKEAFYDCEFDDELYNIMVKDFICKVFIDGKGNLLYADNGVPSGSMFTQIIGSIVNRLMILTYSYAKDIRIPHMMIMGDDNILFSVDVIDTEDLEGYLKYVFGVTANNEKCSYTQPHGNPEFLSRVWYSNGCYRTPEVLISKLLYPEKFRDYRKHHEASPLQIIYAYYCTYPLGMKEIIPEDAIEEQKQLLRIGDRRRIINFMTGVERYRALYLAL